MDLKCLMLVSLVHLYMQIEHSTGYILTQSQIVNLYVWELTLQRSYTTVDMYRPRKKSIEGEVYETSWH